MTLAEMDDAARLDGWPDAISRQYVNLGWRIYGPKRAMTAAELATMKRAMWGDAMASRPDYWAPVEAEAFRDAWHAVAA